MGKPRLLLAAIVSAVLILSPTAVVASNFGAWFADGRGHIFIYVSLGAAYTTASNNARSTDLNPTDINTSMTSAHDTADVAVYDEDHGDAGYYGYYQCITASSSSVCTHSHAVFNTWSGLGLNDTKRDSVACHEFGHSVGLKDFNTYWSCMHDDEFFPTVYSDHDRVHINGRY